MFPRAGDEGSAMATADGIRWWQGSVIGAAVALGLAIAAIGAWAKVGAKIGHQFTASERQ